MAHFESKLKQESMYMFKSIIFIMKYVIQNLLIDLQWNEINEVERQCL